MRQTQKNPSVLAYGLLILVLWLALGLRLYRIQVPSLWNDEGTSVALASRDLAAITQGAANDIHPPLYYYLLHFWIQAFGNSELAVRALSALLGTLLVLLTFAFSHSVAGYRVGLIAALFAAWSPFQVYYAQETRMYALSALLATLSMYTFSHLLAQGMARRPRLAQGMPRRSRLAHWQNRAPDTRPPASSLPAVAYVTATILLLYSHYFTVTIVLVQNCTFVWWWLRETRLARMRERWLIILRWLALQVTIGVFYLPWILLSGQQLRTWPAISEPLRLTALATDLLRVFSLGLSGDVLPRWILAGFAALMWLGMVTLGLVARGKKVPRGGFGSVGRAMSLLYLLLPIAIMFVLSLQRPMYNPKFLLLCTPAFYLFLAQGAVSLANAPGCIRRYSKVQGPARGDQMARFWSWLPLAILAAAVIFVAGASFLALRAYYFNPRYARDDYRGIAQYIQAVEHEEPEGPLQGGDAILINAPGQIETFTYYYRGELPLYPLPRQRPLNEAETETDLQRLVLGRGRVFAVLWATDESDPGRFIEGWLDQHTYKAMDSWYGNVRLVVYAVPLEPPHPSTGDIQHPMQINLGNQVRFLGYNLPTTELMPGDILQLTLFWQAASPIDKRYKVFTHVLDGFGHLVGQRDAEPGGGAKITTIWKEGELVVDNYGLPILPATPPGEYMIEIGMYGLDDGARLPIIPAVSGANGEAGQPAGDHILLQPVRVLPAAAPPPLSVLAMMERREARFDEITLLGYNLTRLGLEHEPDAPIHPGDMLHLTLFWQASQKPLADMALQLQLRDEKGTVRLEIQTTPTEGLYPVREWSAGEIVRDQHNLSLPADLPPARYHLYLSVQHSPGGQPSSAPFKLGSVLVR